MSNLLPGAGWSGATIEPAAQGAPGAVGYNAKAIARWDVVPFQTFTGAFNVGVVAFHREGINRVEFAVNGGPWFSVTTPAINPQVGTGKPEYWVTLNAADFADGPIEVRAVVYPNVGACRVLGGAFDADTLWNGQHSIFLTANAGSSLPATTRYVSSIGGSDAADGLTVAAPLQTIAEARSRIRSSLGGDVGGGRIKLLAGSYTLGHGVESWTYDAKHQFLTIEPAEGVAQSDVVITGSGSPDGLRTTKVRLHGVTVTGGIAASSGYLWLSNCKVVGSGLDAMLGPANWTAKYYTDVNVSTARRFFTQVALARNCTFDRIGESGYIDCGLVINCSASNCIRGGAEYHPDVYQFTMPVPNTIAYGFMAIEGINQTFGIRMQPFGEDRAIVESRIVMGDSLYLWEMERPYENILIQGTELSGAFNYAGTFSAKNLVFKRCTFPAGRPGAHEGVEFLDGDEAPAPAPQPTPVPPSPAPTPAPASIPQPPIVTSEFPNATVRKGGNHTFSIQASGPNLEYKWQKGTTILRGVTGPTYTVSLAKPKDAGVYAVKVWNSDGAVQASARLTVV